MRKNGLTDTINRVKTVSFMLTLAILSAVFISGMLFTGASDTDDNNSKPAEEQEKIEAIYFESAPTEEQLAEAINKAEEAVSSIEEQTTGDIIYDDTVFPIFDISAYIAQDDPASKYQPVGGENYGLDMEDIIAFATEKPNDLKCVYGTYINADMRSEGRILIEFQADVNKYTFYTKKMVFKNDKLDFVNEHYFNPTSRIRVLNGELISIEPNIILSQNKDLYIGAQLYQQNTESSYFVYCGKGEVADYGVYEGRKAVRVKGVITDLDYLAMKTLTYTYERIYDIETGCLLEAIGYDEDGNISGYQMFTGLVFSDELAVPEYNPEN